MLGPAVIVRAGEAILKTSWDLLGGHSPIKQWSIVLCWASLRGMPGPGQAQWLLSSERRKQQLKRKKKKPFLQMLSSLGRSSNQAHPC